MNMQTVEMKLSEAKRGMELEKKRHEQAMKEFQKQMDEAKREKDLLLANLDLERIKRAEKILSVKEGGKYFDKTCVQDAIADIVNGTNFMQDKYFGSKNYAHWSNQRSDHGYLYGPTHGTIVCSIGLKASYRNGLTDEQKEDCLYYLNLMLDDGKRSQLLAG